MPRADGDSVIQEALKARVRSLVDELKAPSFDRRKQIIDELKAIGPDSIPQLVDAIKQENRKLRLNAADALAQLGDPAIPVLVDLLRNSKDDGVRRQAAWALGNTPQAPIRAIEDLRFAASKDPSKWVRWRAGMTLGAMGESAQAAIPDLILLAQDPDRLTRSVSVEALVQINVASAAQVELFEKLLNDSHLNVRRAAIFGLGKFGALSQEVLPRLEQIKTHDPDDRLRRDAQIAIQQITNSSASVAGGQRLPKESR